VDQSKEICGANRKPQIAKNIGSANRNPQIATNAEGPQKIL
jgi:hypothetical protein